MSSTVSTPLSSTEQVLQRIEDLKSALQSRSPGYEHLLKIIHKNLLDDPDVVNLLKPEEIGTVVAALAQKKGIVLAASIPKGNVKNTTTTGKKLSQVTLDDLI